MTLFFFPTPQGCSVSIGGGRIGDNGEQFGSSLNPCQLGAVFGILKRDGWEGPEGELTSVARDLGGGWCYYYSSSAPPLCPGALGFVRLSQDRATIKVAPSR